MDTFDSKKGKITNLSEPPMEQTFSRHVNLSQFHVTFIYSNMEYITESGLRALDNYAYKPGVYTQLDLLLKPFWNWAASKIPRSIAPNVVTLTGTSFLLSIMAVVYYFDPHLEGNVPSLGYFYISFSIWAYQTFDAMDGAHARATGSSSPLGQLFDHGCDALGTTPLAIGLSSALGLGTSMSTLLLFAVIQIPFWFCQFEEHYSHTLRTQVMNFGVTEGQYAEAFVVICTAMFGKGFWGLTMNTFFGDMVPEWFALKHVILLLGAIFPTLMLFTSCATVIRSTNTPIRALIQFLPVALSEMMLIWIANSDSLRHLFVDHTIPLLFFFGILFTHLSNVMIISTVCRMNYPAIHPINIPLPFIWILFNLTSDPDEHFIVLFAYGILIVVQYLHYIVKVMNAIAQHLNIKVLSLGPRNPSLPSKSSGGSSSNMPNPIAVSVVPT